MSGTPARGPRDELDPHRRLEKSPACEQHFSATLSELHDAHGVVVHAADESAYDWRCEQWSVPVHPLASKVLKVGDQTVSVGGGRAIGRRVRIVVPMAGD